MEKEQEETQAENEQSLMAAVKEQRLRALAKRGLWLAPPEDEESPEELCFPFPAPEVGEA